VLRRAQEIRRDIGAIFITGILDRDVLARAMALNPYTYLHKPFELQHLAAIIESYLRQHPPAPS
ncbi:MAG: response regulator, partial [Chloroflexi bacterium]